MRTPSNSIRVLGAVAVVALVVTAGCLSGPLGAGTTDATTTAGSVTDATTTAGTERTTDDGPGTGERSSTDGTDDPESSDVAVERADPADAPDLASELPDPVACGDGGWVSYWGTGDPGQLWRTAGELRIGLTVPANQSTLFVAFEITTAVGANHVEYDHAVTADGDAIDTGTTTGERRYAVVMMQDVNGNGEYDPGTDRPCKDDSDDAGADAIVVSDWLWVDWDGED